MSATHVYRENETAQYYALHSLSRESAKETSNKFVDDDNGESSDSKRYYAQLITVLSYIAN